MKQLYSLASLILFIPIGILLYFKQTYHLPIKPETHYSDSSIQDVRLKIGPVWHQNESSYHLVYGVPLESPEKEYITELHFNFGGKISCPNKTMSALFDFQEAPELIQSDSINTLLEGMEKIIQRKRKDAVVEFEFKNPSPGILMFAIEKMNLKPDNKSRRVGLKIKSDCEDHLEVDMELSKYKAADITQLADQYIDSKLKDLEESELKQLKVIFSFNKTFDRGSYLIDMVDQRTMWILSYDTSNQEYIIKDFEKNEVKRIKRD